MNDAVPEALFRFFEALPRQGPGSEPVTRGLYDRLRDDLPSEPDAADMGCGSGAAGIVLAGAGARVTGIDVHRPFLDAFAARAARAGLADRVTCRAAGMLEAGFGAGSLDLIWSEGAVFTVGFDAALETFRTLLKPGGFAVVSECCWFQEARPPEPAAFWAANYPAMRGVGDNILAAERLGYRFHHAEILPSRVWEEGFYAPMEAHMDTLSPDADPALWEIALECRAEIALFRRWHTVYGYVFYVLRKPAG